jgi:hypothetical protein
MSAPKRRAPRPLALAVALACCAADVGAATLTWTCPATHVTGTPITDGYRRWDLAYSTPSKTWAAKRAAMLASQDSFAFYWPQVAMEADRRVILSGWERPGYAVTLAPPPPVMSLDWPFAWWTRYWTDVPGEWSNPVSRASNE